VSLVTNGVLGSLAILVCGCPSSPEAAAIDSSATDAVSPGGESANTESGEATTLGSGADPTAATPTPTSVTTDGGAMDDTTGDNASADGGPPVVFDVDAPATDSTAGQQEEYVDWLLNAENGALNHISRVDATVTPLCDLVDPRTGETLAFSSMTFTRDDRLFGSGASDLYEVTLPGCDVTYVGPYGPGANGVAVTGINGISPDEDYGLFGVDSTTDYVYRIDPETAAVEAVGYAGFNIGFGGASWVETEQQMLAVDANTDTLYRVDTNTGLYTDGLPLSETLGLVGFEHHPHGGQLYACTNANGGTARGLYEVELDGTMTFIGDTMISCNDLAAPWANPELPPVG